jgi:hypothetical protein
MNKKIRKKRWKKMPWSKYRSIEKRFLDLRFTGVENALNHYARCEEGDRDKQYVFDGTSFQIGKGIEDLNNYDPTKTYLGKATCILKRKYRGKYYVYKITMEDITPEYDQKYKDPMYAFAAEKPSTGKIIHLQQVSKKGNKWQI